MEFSKSCLVLLFVGVIWSCVLGLQRPPPRYSQQYMPDTAFSCRNKIVGSYYADPETDCQLFHVCVSVAGSIQDYKFLCPNDTAFDQESQTCADWYDVDCEASTLYYASDNFDLYRIGSGLESLHYDSLRSDAEPQDHLQRSESNDPVRSSANSLNRVSNNNYNTNNNNNNNNNGKDLVRSSNNNFYNSKNKDKTEEYESEKYKDESEEPKKKSGVRKVSRKQTFNNGNGNNFPTSTVAPTPSNQNTYNGFYSNNNYNQRQTQYVAPTTTTTTIRPQQDYRSQSTQRFSPVTSSTYRPTTNYQETYNAYQSPSTTARPTSYAYNVNPTYSSQTPQSVVYNQQSTTLKTSNNYNPNPTYDSIRQNNAFAQSTTLRPVVTYTNNRNYQDQSYNTNNNNNQYTQSTTIQPPSTNYQSNDFAYQQRNYNNILRTTNNNGANGAGTHQSTTPATAVYETNYNTYNNHNNKNGQYKTTGPVIASTTIKPDVVQTTARYYPTYAVSNGYTPTTYSPNINNNGNNKKFDNGNTNQYYDKSSNGVTPVKPSTQYYDSTKAPKKATQYNNYDANGKYYETSTSSSNNYDYSRSVAAGIGFSPASINHLAETPRSTTPVPRRIPPVSNPTTYNPNSFSSNTQRSIAPSSTTPRSGNYVSGSARPFSSTTRFAETTTPKPPKSGKKNDYDYAYYDNGAPLEYDGLDLEHVAGNKESSKIARSSN